MGMAKMSPLRMDLIVPTPAPVGRASRGPCRWRRASRRPSCRTSGRDGRPADRLSLRRGGACGAGMPSRHDLRREFARERTLDPATGGRFGRERGVPSKSVCSAPGLARRGRGAAAIGEPTGVGHAARLFSARYRSTSSAVKYQSRLTLRARSLPLRICCRRVAGARPRDFAASGRVITLAVCTLRLRCQYPIVLSAGMTKKPPRPEGRGGQGMRVGFYRWTRATMRSRGPGPASIRQGVDGILVEPRTSRSRTSRWVVCSAA